MPIVIDISTPVVVSRTETREAVSRVDRTVRAVIETPTNGPHSIMVYREIQLLDASGALLEIIPVRSPVLRLASVLAGESVILSNGDVITGEQIIEALPSFFDRWTQEDITAGRR